MRDVLREIERLEGELSRIARELAELKKQVPGAPRRKTQAFTRPPPAAPTSGPSSERSGPRSAVSPSSAPESLLGPPPPPPSSIPAPALGAGTQTEGLGPSRIDPDADRWEVRPPSTPTPSEVRPSSQGATPSRRHAVNAGRYEIVGEGRRKSR